MPDFGESIAFLSTFLTFNPAWGLLGLGAFGFLSATLLPGGSEAVLLAFLAAQPESVWPALLVITLGNTAGGMVSWWCGYTLPAWQRLENSDHVKQVRHWGSPILLLSWLPFVGDFFCLAAGWLRLHWVACMGFMAIGKALRYGVVSAFVL